MNTSAKGARFEHAVKKALEADGYDLTRSSGSHGPADLIADKTGERLYVQCKATRDGWVRPAEWNPLHALALRNSATAVIAHRPRRGHIAYKRITGSKDGSGQRQPWEPWTPDRVEVQA